MLIDAKPNHEYSASPCISHGEGYVVLAPRRLCFERRCRKVLEVQEWELVVLELKQGEQKKKHQVLEPESCESPVK